ncbi:MAG: hypothetical protein IJX08_04685 [Clostridia bacterium]|nr:hypothetical protein [Clostridia bacterium]
MRYLIIDIGSNTVKYDLFEVHQETVRTLGIKSRAVRIINYIVDGCLTPEGYERLCETLLEYKEDAKSAEAALFCFATASFRRLSDPASTIVEIKKRTDIEVRLLSGEEEGAYSFKGMLATLHPLPPQGFMIDMGGGSTELNLFEKEQTLFLYSCPFGALSTKNAAGVDDRMSASQCIDAKNYVKTLLPPEISSFGAGGKRAVMVGGTGKACKTMARELLGIKEANKLTRAQFSSLLRLVCDPSQEVFEKMKLLVPQRYQLMGAGIAAFDAIFDASGCEEIFICSGGIRDGYLYELLKQEQ